MDRISEDKIAEETRKIAEEFYGTATDPDQIPITKASHDKLFRLHPKTFVYKLIDGQPVSWVLVLPTTKELTRKFLAKEINEKQLLDLTQPQKEYEAIYLLSAFTLPAYRRRGYALELFQEAIKNIPHTKNTLFFYWSFSEEGEKLATRVSLDLGADILKRKS